MSCQWNVRKENRRYLVCLGKLGRKIDAFAHSKLQIPTKINPVMTLSFMPLSVIPELKITDMGLVDVNNFKFVPLEYKD
ncbi:adenine deaminase C-terminal domain-containing protein [Ligilactobacillus agilis]|uniref:adenine deaminase C-terminal domain-containing protein n=1 Tax=Ligilactobacillus agilis TaxID=1601 RepID=UPI00117B1A8A|nr:adenine deaminase C-terminal domain-containing protein [Ligilactobacillus agilis]MBL1055133.1 hypothetical protein [Ligilactobacillus agilis]NJE32972.1 hypothetical protein [Ligilactobacillus agilis]UNL43570.1 hypothetical protein G8B22_05260 [Ligilactobacillus agilis]UNL59169.1 hypothetical protein G8B19_06600 [Ligilactobacillus agilis]